MISGPLGSKDMKITLLHDDLSKHSSKERIRRYININSRNIKIKIMHSNRCTVITFSSQEVYYFWGHQGDINLV